MTIHCNFPQPPDIEPVPLPVFQIHRGIPGLACLGLVLLGFWAGLMLGLSTRIVSDLLGRLL